jgi:hypothetical protein
MSFYKKLLLLSTLFCVSTQAHDEPGVFEQVRVGFKNATNLGWEDVEVHPTVKELSHEAQAKVGVAQPLPILYMNPQHPLTQYADAATTTDGIYLNPATLQKPYGIIRSSLFHEAVHAKHEDYKNILHTTRLSSLAGAIAGYTACRKLSKSKRVSTTVYRSTC